MKYYLTPELNPNGLVASIETNLLYIPTASSMESILASLSSFDSLKSSLNRNCQILCISAKLVFTKLHQYDILYQNSEADIASRR